MTVEEYLRVLNLAIDPHIAATLAGLAFAIAALLYSSSNSIGSKITGIQAADGEPSQRDIATRYETQRASRLAINSSYCFIIFLITEIASSPLPPGFAPPRTITFTDGFSVASAVGSGGIGLLLLYRSARIVKHAM